ncbi:MAG: L-rhamnose mutarotase [Micrococcales bacterium]|nr:L-rhamnose mutarotase [Micrococcales bacterium]
MFQLRVRPERLREYRAAHAAVSRDMLEALRDAGWRNYSIFESEGGVVTGYFEADDLAEAQRLVAATDANARWQALMAPFFAPTDAAFADPGEPGSAPVRFLTEIFNLDAQLAASASAPAAEKDPR